MIVHAAALASAHTVARAALETQAPLESTPTLAARGVAATAESAALGMREDELASMTASSVAADLSVATREPRTPRARAGQVAAAKSRRRCDGGSYESTRVTGRRRADTNTRER
jgi:hypothetical protein